MNIKIEREDKIKISARAVEFAKNNTNRLTKEQNDKNKVSTTMIRNIFNKARQPDNAFDIFKIYIHYQIGRFNSSDIQNYLNKLLEVIDNLFVELKITDKNSPEANAILMYFLEAIVMESKYLIQMLETHENDQYNRDNRNNRNNQNTQHNRNNRDKRDNNQKKR